MLLSDILPDQAMKKDPRVMLYKKQEKESKELKKLAREEAAKATILDAKKVMA